jgi:uncharacterized protein DUF3846
MTAFAVCISEENGNLDLRSRIRAAAADVHQVQLAGAARVGQKKPRKKVEVGLLFRVGAEAPEKVKPSNGKSFSLKELQQFVGGYIEYVPHSTPIAYCNEEGRLKNLPLNRRASVEFQQLLVGDVIQVFKETA